VDCARPLSGLHLASHIYNLIGGIPAAEHRRYSPCQRLPDDAQRDTTIIQLTGLRDQLDTAQRPEKRRR